MKLYCKNILTSSLSSIVDASETILKADIFREPLYSWQPNLVDPVIL